MAKGLTLTANRLRELLNYDPEMGIFTRRVRCGPAHVGDIAGALTSDGYVSIKVDGRSYLGHRLAWLHVFGEWPQADLDHISGEKTNNRLSNLRDVSRVVNAQNQRRAHADSATGHMGVTKWNGKFVAQIGAGGKILKLGRFETPQEAHQAYLIEKRRLHAGCTI